MSHNFIGGHSKVFLYIPENEIWVSNLQSEEEIKRTSLHEFVEYKLMRDEGYNYAKAHIEALKTEGNITEAEIEKRRYIEPEQTIVELTKGFPILSEKENEWKLDDKRTVKFDDIKGIIYLWEEDKIRDQVLVRSTEDIEKFVSKYKVEADINSLKASVKTTEETIKQVAELQKTVFEMKASVDQKTVAELEYAKKRFESDTLLAEKKAAAYEAIASKWK